MAFKEGSGGRRAEAPRPWISNCLSREVPSHTLLGFREKKEPGQGPGLGPGGRRQRAPLGGSGRAGSPATDLGQGQSSGQRCVEQIKPLVTQVQVPEVPLIACMIFLGFGGLLFEGGFENQIRQWLPSAEHRGWQMPGAHKTLGYPVPQWPSATHQQGALCLFRVSDQMCRHASSTHPRQARGVCAMFKPLTGSAVPGAWPRGSALGKMISPLQVWSWDLGCNRCISESRTQPGEDL